MRIADTNLPLSTYSVKTLFQEVMEDWIMNRFFTVNELGEHFQVNAKTITMHLTFRQCLS